MGKRTNIINEVVEILSDSTIFYKIYKEPTDIEKEKSFPVAWINLGAEDISDGTVSTTNYFRTIDLEITIGSKHNSTSTDMNDLVDVIFDLMKSNYTLGGQSINVTPISIRTDQGYFHPYAFFTINFRILTR